MSNLTTRVIVAIVGIPLVVGTTVAGGAWFLALILVVSLLAQSEYYRLAEAKGVSPQTAVGLFFGACIVLTFFHARIQPTVVAAFHAHGMAIPFPTMSQTFLIVLLVFIPLVLAQELFRNRPQALANTAVTVAGVLYVPFFLGSLVGLRELFISGDFPITVYFPLTAHDIPADVEGTVYRWGGYTVLAVFASIWICDSAAYFAGRAFGRHKLFPRVSPNKSWEGAVAGFIGAVLTFMAARALALPYLTVVNAVVCGLIVGVFGQLGDLVESLLKRDAGVKDSSSMIPGHGGVLDRFDSLMFVAPLLFLYLDFIVF